MNATFVRGFTMITSAKGTVSQSAKSSRYFFSSSFGKSVTSYSSSAAGDVGQDVLTGVHKLRFDPAIYRANALQGLIHDPARKDRNLQIVYMFTQTLPTGVVPQGVDFNAALRAERTRERQRHIEEQRRRRLSDSHV